MRNSHFFEYQSLLKSSIVLLLLSLLVGTSAFAQGIQNFKLSYGNNRTAYHTGYIEKTLLPDYTVAENIKINSYDRSGFSFGATLGFAISKDKQWSLNTGLLYQNFELGTSIFPYSEGIDYSFIRGTKVDQLELPILVSWRNSGSKFRFGGDVGVIKALAVWSKYTETGSSSGIGTNPNFESNKYNFKGAVNLLEKYSVYVAPTIGYDFSEKMGIEFQPYYRYQTGNNSEDRYDNKGGAPISQYGINLNLVTRF